MYTRRYIQREINTHPNLHIYTHMQFIIEREERNSHGVIGCRGLGEREEEQVVELGAEMGVGAR